MFANTDLIAGLADISDNLCTADQINETEAAKEQIFALVINPRFVEVEYFGHNFKDVPF